MSMRCAATAVLVLAGAFAATGASAQSAPNCPTMRKINVGVSVAPPNVVHTAPYVAKALGFFAKRCIDANIVQFEGGQSQTANVAAAQGTAIISVSDVAIGRGLREPRRQLAAHQVDGRSAVAAVVPAVRLAGPGSSSLLQHHPVRLLRRRAKARLCRGYVCGQPFRAS